MNMSTAELYQYYKLRSAQFQANTEECLEMLKTLASSTAVLNHLDAETNEALCDLIRKMEKTP